MTIKQYSLDGLTAFQRKAISEKGSEFQRSILKNALEMNSDDFVDWLDHEVAENATEKLSFVGEKEMGYGGEPPRYTASEFREPPAATAATMWQAWQNMKPGVACSFAVWGYIVSRMIVANKIEAHYLIVSKSNGTKTDGRKEIDDALRVQDKDTRNKAIDKCVRSFLLRLSGLYVERSARSVYQNCPPAKVWWQHYLTKQIAASTAQENNRVIGLLRKPAVWEVLTEKMASRLTIIGDKNIRDGLVWYLLDNPIFCRKESMNALIKAIGIMSAWRALGYFEPARVRDIIAKEIAPQLCLDNLPEDTDEEDAG